MQIIDPFTGTGTFIVRLLQSGLIRPEDLLRKYTSELHANEIVLLAYYIAAVNIEAAFHDIHQDDYVPFDGIVLTDTFQLAEGAAFLDATLFPENNERVKRQKAQNIRVVIGNPPYSAGQTSQNDANQNLKYPILNRRIEETYAARSTATNKNSLYDSYIRAIRWASDRIRDNGIVCFVSNGGYIDSNSADGLRKTLADEFSAIYCFNLRGNQRTSGELAKKEGGKIFGSASRSTVAISVLVKTVSRTSACQIYYHDIGDYLNRDQKLQIIGENSLDTIQWKVIEPSPEGDWVNQRSSTFRDFIQIGKKGNDPHLAIFDVYSPGLKSNRDVWVYNSSRRAVESNARRMIDFFNTQLEDFSNFCRRDGITDPNGYVYSFIDNDTRKISWSSSLVPKVSRGRRLTFNSESLTTAMYRPFNRQTVYFDDDLVDRLGKLPRIFPSPRSGNIGLYVTGLGALKSFSILAVDCPPDLNLWGSEGGQFFPRYIYRSIETEANLFASVSNDGYERFDNISDGILTRYRRIYGPDMDKDDIFYYVYGLLHSPTYRDNFAADLKKMLPRVPEVKDFDRYSDAGRKLATLHLGYEGVAPYPLEETLVAPDMLPQETLYRVQQMAFGKGKDTTKDRSRIVYNSHLILSGIPDGAYRYTLGSKSAIEWIMERYQVKTDKASGIINDPNEWSNDPRYIVDLLKRIVTVSLESMKIIDALPEFEVL